MGKFASNLIKLRISYDVKMSFQTAVGAPGDRIKPLEQVKYTYLLASTANE